MGASALSSPLSFCLPCPPAQSGQSGACRSLTSVTVLPPGGKCGETVFPCSPGLLRMGAMSPGLSGCAGRRAGGRPTSAGPQGPIPACCRRPGVTYPRALLAFVLTGRTGHSVTSQWVLGREVGRRVGTEGLGQTGAPPPAANSEETPRLGLAGRCWLGHLGRLQPPSQSPRQPRLWSTVVPARGVVPVR